MSKWNRAFAVGVFFVVLVAGVAARAQSPFEFSTGFGESGVGRESTFIGGNFGTSSVAKVTRNGVSTTFVSGPFNRFGDVAAPLIATFDGVDFGPIVPPPFQAISSMCAFDDGTGEKLYVAAIVAQVFGTNIDAVFSFDGTTWTQVGVNLDFQFPAKILVFDSGSGPELVCCGVDSIGGATIGGVVIPGTPVPSKFVRFSGGQWVTLGTPTVPMDDYVDATIHDDGQGPAIYGVFKSYLVALPTFTLESRVLRLVAGQWTQFGPTIPGPGPSSSQQSGGARVLASVDDGVSSKLYLGGESMNTASQLLEVTSTSVVPIGTINSRIDQIGAFGQSPDRKVVVTGGFNLPTPAGSAQGIAFWNGTSFEKVGTIAVSGTVLCVAESDAGGLARLLVVENPPLALGSNPIVGRFMTFDGVHTTTYARNGANGAVLALATYDDGGGAKLYAGGAFTRMGRTNIARLARWDGSNWTAVGTGANGNVSALAGWNDGVTSSLAIGGSFSSINGVAARGLALLTGSTVSSIGNVLKGTSTGTVYAIAAYDDGTGPELYIGGDFSSVAGVPCNGLARRKNGVWSSVGTGLIGSSFGPIVYALEVHDFGAGPILFIGGDFDGAVAGPVSRSILAWDGTNFSGCAGGVTGDLSFVYALESHFDGTTNRLILGGEFEGAGGVAANAIVAWDGTAFSDLQIGVDPPSSVGARFVTALASYDEGSDRALVVGGYFTGAQGIASSGIMRFKNGQWFGMDGGIAHAGFPNVAALAVHDDGYCDSVFVGGSFGTAGEHVSLNIAAWRPTGAVAGCDILGSYADGQVGVAIGGPFPVLRINGSHGVHHCVVVSLNQSVQISMLNPTTPFASGFAIFGLLREATPSDAVTLPLGFGTASFMPCPLDPANPELFLLNDSLGVFGCTPILGPALAPWIATFPGVGFPFTFTLQGVAVDPTSTLGLALTNAVVVKVR